jgi:hypothetical protein
MKGQVPIDKGLFIEDAKRSRRRMTNVRYSMTKRPIGTFGRLKTLTGRLQNDLRFHLTPTFSRSKEREKGKNANW